MDISDPIIQIYVTRIEERQVALSDDVEKMIRWKERYESSMEEKHDKMQEKFEAKYEKLEADFKKRYELLSKEVNSIKDLSLKVGFVSSGVTAILMWALHRYMGL